MNIDQQINDLDLQIKNLQEQKSKLQEQKINSSTTFRDKFLAWLEKEDNKKIDRWLPSTREFPLFRKYIDNWDLDRHRTYDIFEYFFEEQIGYFEDPEGTKEYLDIELKKDPEYLNKLEAVFQELMKGNLKKFTCDW